MKGLQFLLLFVFISVVIAEATARKAEKDHYKKPHYRSAKKFEHHHHKIPKHFHHERIGHHGNHDEMHSTHRENEEVKKHTKAAFHHAPYFVSHHEARLQSDLSATKKSPMNHHLDESRDMHLQDLTFQSPGHRSPHHFQRGNHRVSHHPFTNHREDRVKTHHREGHHKMMSDFQDDDKRGGVARSHEPFHHSMPVLSPSHHTPVSDGRQHSILRKTDHGRLMPKKAFEKGKKSATKKDSKKRAKAKKHYEW